MGNLNLINVLYNFQMQKSGQEASDSDPLSEKNSGQISSEDEVDLDRPNIQPPDPESVVKKKLKSRSIPGRLLSYLPVN